MPRIDELPPERVADAVAKAVAESVGRGGDTEMIVARALSQVKGELSLGDSNPRPAPPVTEGPSLRLPVHPQPRSATAPRSSAAHRPTTAPNGLRPAPMGSGKTIGGSNGSGRPLITEADVIAAWRSGQTELRVAPGSIVTALARDTARDAGLRLVEG